ncbi:MAG: NAD+ synthase [Desulfobacteraceae bacterium]|nr:MAG: NAD+ synthase [Desulfobacteraceae bacterium]
MRIALCQINPIIGDFDYNIALIKEAGAQARKQECDLAVFPELSLLGYPPKDLLERPAFIAENLDRLKRLAAEWEGIALLCGYVDLNPLKTGKPLINSVALIRDKQIIQKGGKRLLPTYDVFDEARYFEPAAASLLFELQGLRIGVTICEDIWNVGDIEDLPHYPIDPVKTLSERGMDLLINISGSPFTLHKNNLRRAILAKLSALYRVPVLFCNQVGGNDDLLFDGATMVMDARGNRILQAKEFEPDLLVWDSEKTYPVPADPTIPEEESVLKALVMGTRDYALKCGFKKALVGLSGGIDSSLVAVIAQKALGAENVLGVGMPSPYTAFMSREDARTLTQNIGIAFEEIPITQIYKSFQKELAKVFKDRPADVTEENLQARIRGNLLMALSNKFGYLLLTTGNKSELAVGYCTLYGDMCGGLAVIADLPKTLCYRLARYLNKDNEIIPERVLIRPPTAELRADQTDQDTLPPYDILDRIIEAAVVHNQSTAEIIQQGFEPEVVRDVLHRLYANEYKRRQAPPGLKITTKAFGYGRRYPLAKGRQVF